MKYYNKVLKEIKHRKINRKISFLLKKIFDSFVTEDKVKLLNVFYVIYVFANNLGIFFNVCMCLFIFYKIPNNVLGLLLCGIYVLLSITIERLNCADEIRSDVSFLAKYTSKKELNKILFVHWNNHTNLIKIILIWLSVNIEYILMRSFSILFPIFSFLVLFCCVILSFVLFFYKVCNISLREFLSFQYDIVINLMKLKEDTIKKVKYKDFFYSVLSRQIQQSKILSSDKIMFPVFGLFLCFMYSLHFIFHIKLFYLDIVLINLFPVILNYFCFGIVSSCLIENSFVSMNYYLIKKYSIRGMLVRTTRSFFLNKSKFYVVLWATFILIMNVFDVKILILLALNLIQWFSITFIVSVNTFSYYKYEYDDLKDGCFVGLMQNPFIDFLIGLPVILVALCIYIARSSVVNYMFIMGGYTLGLVAFSLIMYFALNHSDKKEHINCA